MQPRETKKENDVYIVKNDDFDIVIVAGIFISTPVPRAISILPVATITM